MAKIDTETKIMIALSVAMIGAVLAHAAVVNSTTDPALLRARAYAVDACLIKMAHEDIDPHQKADLCAGLIERMEATPAGVDSGMLGARTDFMFRCMAESTVGNGLSKINEVSQCEQLLKRIEK